MPQCINFLRGVRIWAAFLVISIALIVFSSLAQAGTLTAAEIQSFHSLRLKLNSANVDITQAMKGMGPNSASRCLGLIHDQGQSAAMTAAPIVSLMVLSALMKEPTDELLVLRELQVYLTGMTRAMPDYRETINGVMGLCADFAVVTAKGQAVLNILSGMNEQASSLQKIIARATSPK